jgi:hypothetical protein
MMPGNVLSTTPIPAPLLQPDNWDKSPFTDFELGGVAVSDTSQGLDSYIWKVWSVDGNVFINRVDLDDDTDAVLMFYRKNCRNLGLAFDQNMRPAVSYTVGPDVYLYWYDTAISAYTITQFAGCRSPGITLDDKRLGQTSISDVILFYIRLDKFYMRVQRDRYLIEYFLYDLPANYELKHVGMGSNLRLQFVFEPIL